MAIPPYWLSSFFIKVTRMASFANKKILLIPWLKTKLKKIGIKV